MWTPDIDSDLSSSSDYEDTNNTAAIVVAMTIQGVLSGPGRER